MLPNRTRREVKSVLRQLESRGVRGLHFTYAPDAHHSSRNQQTRARLRFLKSYLRGKGRPFRFNDSKRSAASARAVGVEE